MRFPSTSIYLALAATCATAAISLDADATVLRRVSGSERVQRAELIAQAVVVDIQHRNSSVRGSQDAEMPHTFVTFSLEHVLKGTSKQGANITLRFLGGPTGKGLTLVVGGIPRFRLGDRDLLFVERNGESDCPLVGWEQSRFRIVRGQVFNDLGQEVWVSPQGDFLFGDQLIDVRDPHYRPVVGESADGRQPQRRSPPQGSVIPNAIGMRAIVRHMRDNMAKAGNLPVPNAFKTARLDLPFHVPAPRVKRAPRNN